MRRSGRYTRKTADTNNTSVSAGVDNKENVDCGSGLLVIPVKRCCGQPSVLTARNNPKRPCRPNDTADEVDFLTGADGESGSGAICGAGGTGGSTDVIRKSVRVRGATAVDTDFPLADHCHVLVEQSTTWHCMLHQTSVQRNSNKFYLIQLLQHSSDRSYHVWMRWGRVGYTGLRAHTPCGADLQRAKQIVAKKFLDKTYNEWSERASFQKVDGKYDLVDTSFAVDSTDGADVVSSDSQHSQPPPEPQLPCSLPDQVQQLILLICDVQLMRQTVVDMEYDAAKAPLGQLTKCQILGGYEALKRIDSLVRCGQLDGQLWRACDEFYTRIPHCFGMRRPPLIQTRDQVCAKLRLLETLSDIRLALKVIDPDSDGSMTDAGRRHPIDSRYLSLNCHLTPLAADSNEYSLVCRYVASTHGHTHSAFRLIVGDIMRVRRDIEWRQFDNRGGGGRCLLWHGSRLTNWAGILAAGLKIAPPEAPSTGYMFGKGIYFADVVSKSANYCWATPSQAEGLLLLCEVALGKCRELTEADSDADRLPPGFDSVLGLGRHVARPEHATVTCDGVQVPLGPLHCVSDRHTPLLYNEYVVYSERQVRMRYLVRVKFDYV